MADEKKKKIILTCRQLIEMALPCIEKYQGVELLGTPHGTVAIHLGTQVIEVATPENAKVVIDSWNELKLN